MSLLKTRSIYEPLLTVVLAISTAALVAGFLGELSPFLDLFSLVALPLSVLNLVSAALLLWLSRGRHGAHRVLLFVCMVPAIVVFMPDRQRGHCASLAPRLRIAWLNAQRSDRSAPILSWIEREQPQIIAFGELDKGSLALRSQLVRRYPHWQSCLANGRCSTVLHARFKPILAEPLARGDPEDRRSLSAVRMVLTPAGADDVVLITAVHLSRPLPLDRQRAKLSELTQALSRSPREIVIGDFNMSPRMKGLRQFAEETGLRINTTNRPTWPVFPGGLWQIDHVLTGRGWLVTDIRTSPDLGSDHRGIVADLCAMSDFS